MVSDEIKDYSKIIGFSFLSIVKFALVGLIINWLYGLFKISWYVELFEAGGWWIALALLVILIVFAGIPAIYFYMGYQSAIGKAISKAFDKNKGTIANLIAKVARRVAGMQVTSSGTRIVAEAKEYRLVNFIINRMGFKSQWKRITRLKPEMSNEEKEATIQEVLTEIVSAFPEKKAEGFTYNMRTVVLVNIISLLVIEVISRIYPPVAAAI